MHRCKFHDDSLESSLTLWKLGQSPGKEQGIVL